MKYIYLLILLYSSALLGQHKTFEPKNYDKTISFKEVKNTEWIEKDIPFYNVDPKAHWIKLTIPQDMPSGILLLENPILDSAILYNDSGMVLGNLGLSRTINKKKYLNFSLPNIELTKISAGTKYFIKTQSNTLSSVPLKVLKPNKFTEYVSNTNIISGFYFGILFVMLLYNLFVWSSVKEIAYLHYCLYILALIATQLVLQGYFKSYFLPKSYGFNKYSVVLFGSFLGMATLAFANSFLKIKKYAPKKIKGIKIFYTLCILSAILCLLGLQSISFNLINITIGIGSIYLLWIASRVNKAGYKPAKFFILAFAILLLGTTIYVLKDYGLLPYNSFTYYGYQVGSVIQVILLSLALANSINILKKEKEKEQEKKLAALNENKRIIENQKTMLEEQVQEKTKELRATNDNLSTALYDLKNTQVSLVESEKMASLGQLTAGVAHEINNPINFVSSNVNPLIRDFGDINEFIETLLNSANEDETVKSEKIKGLYTDLDISYTQQEISELLQGIKEGANRTAEIVKGLKNFSRLDESAFKTANLEEGLDSTLILLRSNMKGEITLTKEYAGLPEIDCYAGKLNQVFMNLINNSIYAILKDPNKETKKDSAINIITENLDDSINIIIKDSGMGMNEETKSKLFDPFYTTKPVGDGTGLGMSITYSIINEMHNGSVEVESEEGIGTSIKINLPKNLTK